MSTTDTQVQNLIVNKLSYDQWTTTKDAGDLSPTEAYEITDLDTTFDTVANKLSNCILEIPQKLELELSSNTLTLKAGSKPVMTGSSYSEMTVSSDISLSLTARSDGKYIILCNGNTFINPRKLSECTSGPNSSLPSSLGTWEIYFDTDNKVIYHSNSGTPEVWTNATYPLCILEATDGNFSFAKDSNGNDMIFNGAGFIGHHAFVFPNVKALNPDGIDTDGTLKSKKVTISSLLIAEMASNLHTITISGANALQRRTGYSEVKEYVNPALGPQYVIPENIIIYNNLIRNETPFIFFDYNGTTVTDFTIRQPVRLASDSDVVHKTGDETIAGAKTFTDATTFNKSVDILLNADNFPRYACQRTNITKGTTPSSSAYAQWVFQDSTGFSSNSRIGGMEVQYSNNGNMVTHLEAFEPVSGSSNKAEVTVHYDSDGKTYATAPTPTEDTTSSIQIDTVGARNTKLANYTLDSNAVHKTGNETIAGQKTFTNMPTVSHDAAGLRLQNPNITKGTAPSSNKYGYVDLLDKNGYGNSNRIGLLEFTQKPNGQTVVTIAAYKDVAGGTDRLEFSLVCNQDGTGSAYCPTPPAGDSSNKIATTEWVTSNAGASRNIGEIVQSTIPLTDAGLHLLDGDLISGSGSYSAFVTYIAGLVSTYPGLFTTEADWQAAVATYGVCGKFVYDSTNNTIRLPKYSNKIYTTDFASTSPVVGNGYGLTLTNGSQTFAIAHDADSSSTAIGATNQSYVSVGTSTTRFTTQQALALGVPTASQIGNDLSVSGLIADLSNITTPLEGYWYIVIATSTKTDIQVDIDEVMTDLNMKMDVQELATVHCVVETYSNGASWYRLYDDGWVEQGEANKYLSANAETITFLVPFLNTNYIVTSAGRMGSADTNSNISLVTKTTTNMIVNNNNPGNYDWYACGYKS